MSTLDKENIANNTAVDEKEEEDMLVSQLNVSISNQYVLFTVGKEEYGVPILAVQEIISMPPLTRIPGVPEQIPGIINLRGNILSLYVLRNKFNLGIRDNENDVVVIIQTHDDKTVGFIVDNVSDVASITEENLSDAPNFSGSINVKFVEKIGQLGDRMIIILNINNIFTEKENAVREHATSTSI